MLFMNAILAIAIALGSSTSEAPAQTVKETVIVVKKPAKSMKCGAPRALQNDAVQTVRVCEFR
jgi:hypothetical protein